MLLYKQYGDFVVQRTNYYPSGVPMAQSTGQSVQPLKYNAHEYIEAHGYDVYDYGFRGYYATIGRFTSIDPLCERTPWQSPYTYANNNWINQIDILGLAGSDAYTTQDPAKISKLLDFFADGGSLNSFDFDEEGWTEGIDADWWILDEYLYYNASNTITGNITYDKSGIGYIPEVLVTVKHTRLTSFDATAILQSFRWEYMSVGQVITDTAGDIVGWGDAFVGVAGKATCNNLYWVGKNGKVYTVNQRIKGAKGSYVYNRSFELAKCRSAALKVVGVASSVVCTGIDLGICINNPTLDNQMNLAMDLVAFIPYVGWMISTTYFFTNQYVTYKTGVGIGQHLYDLFEQ